MPTKLTQEGFLKRAIKKAQKIYNNFYQYSKVKYFGTDKPIKVICPKHGMFITSFYLHIRKKCGCPQCSKKISFIENQWLKSLKIPNNKKHRQVKIKVNNLTYKADGYDPKTKTIYEFYGDYYHGNPKVFKKQDYNEVCHKTFGELYDKTKQRERKFQKAGYNLISVWECDFRKQLQKM